MKMGTGRFLSILGVTAILLTLGACGGGGSDVLGTAQKGHIIRADVLRGSTVVGSTSDTPGSLGDFDISGVSNFDVLTILGVAGSIDTLDDVLDGTDPSFEGRFLKVVFNNAAFTRANPLTTLVAERFEDLRDSGMSAADALAAAEAEVAAAFDLVIDLQTDMFAQGGEALRLASERVQAVVEFAIAAGGGLESVFAAIAGSFEGGASDGSVADMVEAAAQLPAVQSTLGSVSGTVIILLEEAFPDLPGDSTLSGTQLAFAQGALRDALDDVVDVDVDTILDLADAFRAALASRVPVADAGVDIPNAKVNAVVNLDGQGSSDAKGGGLTFHWTAPAGIVLSNDSSATPSFTPLNADELIFSLIVDNGSFTSNPDDVVVTVEENVAPVADAGLDRMGRPAEAVALNGSSSFDDNGDPLTYAWQVTASPPGSAPQLAEGDQPVAFLTADAEGDYTVSLKVTDDSGSSSEDEVVVEVDADADGIPSDEDNDRDGDNVDNDDDAFPDDPSEIADSDNDGTGNFAQADEDGDGINDRDDFLPFDPAASSYPETAEVEFNDNPVQATPTGASPPFRVTGAIQTDIDGDFFMFEGSEGAFITATLSTPSSDFRPSLAFQDQFGFSLQTIQPSMSATSGITTAVSVVLPRDDTFLVIVNDFNSLGDPSFTYTLDVFPDDDLDAMDDARELALGVNNRRSDDDNDGIFDAAEANVFDPPSTWRPDVDNDGIPNWLDLESDGDRISDFLEGSDDIDGDGLGNAYDLDSDGNGIPDIDEVGPNPEQPFDLDGDGTPDFLDTDNDGDGLLDTADPEPNVPLAVADLLDPANDLIVESVEVVFSTNPSQILPNAARVGDELSINGGGFSLAKDGNTVLFTGEHGPVNINIAAVSTSLLLVEVPERATGRVSVVVDNLQSNWVDFEILPDTAPVLFQPDPKTGAIGDLLTLTGLNFEDGMAVNFGGVQAASHSFGTTELDVNIPIDAESGILSVVSSTGASNSVAFQIVVGGLGAQVNVPPGSGVDPTSLLVSFGLLGEAVPDGNGFATPIEIDNARADSVWVLLPETATEPVTVFLQVLTAPGDFFLTIDTSSTAVAMALLGLGITDQVSAASIPAARDLAVLLPEVLAFRDLLDTSLAADPYVLNKQSPAILIAMSAAVDAAQLAITAGLDSGALDPPDPLGGVQKEDEAALKGDPDVLITPEQHDVMVFAIRTGIISGDLTGNIGVENDSQLYLSTRIKDTRTDALLFKHISSYFDGNMVGPQGLGLLFWASTKDDYKQPNFRDIQVQILTPGVARPIENSTVRNYLALRTFIDRVLLPLITQAIGDIFSPADLTAILVNNAGNAVNTFGTLLTNGDVKGAFKSVMSTILSDVTSVPPGPITKAIAKKLGREAAEEILEKLAVRIGSKLVPGVGQISAAIEILGAASTVTNVGKTFIDFVFTPGVINFGAEWPLQIDSLQPTAIKSEPEPKRITIKGRGFTPVTETGLFSSSTFRPMVFVRDKDPDGSGEIKLDPFFIFPEGREMVIDLPFYYVDGAKGPLEVRVKHRDIEVTSPVDIEVTNEVTITLLSPDEGGPGDAVAIFGTGFSDVRLENKVVFEGGPKRVGATVVAATDTILDVIAPMGVETGPVTVEVDGEVSNGVVYTVNNLDVIIDFGDNGSLNDDTFALFVDGQLIFSMPAPTRSAGPFTLKLTEGRHTVALRGITAPDAIGTYFISITGNVTSVTGDALSGSDLTAGVQKNFVIEVGPTSKAGSFGASLNKIMWRE